MGGCIHSGLCNRALRKKQMATDVKKESSESTVNRIILPAPTPWPFILAFGISLIFGGMVTSVSVTILGAVLTVAGFVGWFRDVLPHEKEEIVEVTPRLV